MDVRLADIVCSALRLETARVPSKQETAYQTRMRKGPNENKIIFFSKLIISRFERLFLFFNIY